MASLRFQQVDVFTDRPFFGNPVAVVMGAEGLDTAAMQRIACWTNLSETTFLLPPATSQADYRLRIFTPRQELPFAGHPTIGSAHAAIESGFAVPRDGRLRQECLAGVLELSVEDDGSIHVRGPEARVGLVRDSVDLGLIPGTPVLRVDVGPVWIVGQVADAIVLGELEPDLARIANLSNALDATGVTLFADSRDGIAAMHVRSFAPAQGIAEDPVCGSGNLGIAAYLRYTQQLGRYGEKYVARQGMQLGRDGRVVVQIAAGGNSIGGKAVTCVEGRILSP